MHSFKKAYKLYSFDSGIFLNSLSSVLSFNSFDLDSSLRTIKDEDTDIITEKEKKQSLDKKLHESTFVKQFLYFVLMVSMNTG